MFYIVEHMEGESISPWVSLEYAHMAEVVEPRRLLFTSHPQGEDLRSLRSTENGDEVSTRDVIFPENNVHALAMSTKEKRTKPLFLRASLNELKSQLDWSKVCLLDMEADTPLRPCDAPLLDTLVFGGILGNVIEKGCPENEQQDSADPRSRYASDDRTGELRQQGFAVRRNLGPWQMTTDTALLVTKLVLEDGFELDEIPWIDEPEVDVNADEGGRTDKGVEEITQMLGFRYVAKERCGDAEWFRQIHSRGQEKVEKVCEKKMCENNGPILPKGMIAYWREACDGAIEFDDM